MLLRLWVAIPSLEWIHDRSMTRASLFDFKFLENLLTLDTTVLIFMALLNYITDAYEIFAASANAAASSCRSVFAVVLPLATTPMFARLGISGACSLLGGLSLVMCVIPFIFIWKGEEIRARSKFCIALKERKEEMERRNEEQQRRIARAAASNGAMSDKETV